MDRRRGLQLLLVAAGASATAAAAVAASANHTGRREMYAAALSL